MIQAQRGLDGFAIQRTNCQPACGPGRERQLERGEWFHGSGRKPVARVRRCNASIQTSTMVPEPSTNPSIASNTSEIEFTGFTL